MYNKILGYLGVLILAGLMAPATASADAVADFYKGKTITVFIGYSPGGGYDRYARTVVRHMGKHIPGNPELVPKNRPGAGSLLLVNELYNTLPKDGTAFGIVGRGMPTEPLFGNKDAKFDPDKFTWLGSANNEVSVCVAWHTTKFKTYEDMKSAIMIVGGTGPGADTDTFPKVMNNVLGTKLKLVTGYPGGNDVNLAIERGEVDGRCGWSWSSVKSTRPTWLKDKKVVILMQMSGAKHPELPDVPLASDLATSDSDKAVLKLIFARQAWGRPFVAPPGLPADRAKALQDAFMATMNDPDFIADAKKQNLELAPISGSEVARLIQAVVSSPREIVEAATKAREYDGNISITKVKITAVTLKGAVTKVVKGGRSIHFGDDVAKISGSRTKVTIGGKPGDRGAITVGMNCTADLKGESGTEAKTVSCQ